MDSTRLPPVAPAIPQGTSSQGPARSVLPQNPTAPSEGHDGSALPSPALVATHPPRPLLTPPAEPERSPNPPSGHVPALPVRGLGWLTAWSAGNAPAFSKAVEEAAEALGLDENITFETYCSDRPAFTEVLNLSQAKAHLEACYFMCADEEEGSWQFLVETTQTLLSSSGFFAEARKWFNTVIPTKPDGLDILVMLSALSTMTPNKRRLVATEAKPLFDRLHPADYATLLAALQRISEADVAQFCKDALRFDLQLNEASQRAHRDIYNVGDVVEQGNLTLAMARPTPTPHAPYDNLAVLCNLAGLGSTRHLAMEAANTLATLLQWDKLPVELAHVFWVTSGSALLWSDAVYSLASKLRHDPPYLATSDLSKHDRRAFMLDLFRAQIERGQPEAPPPYAAADPESTTTTTSRPPSEPPPKFPG